MRQVWLFLFATVFIVGCADHPIPPPAAGDLHMTNDPAMHHVVAIRGLGMGFSINVAANSWPDLVAKTKPAFAWNGCDLLWIKDDGHSPIEFTMDEAYFQATNDESGQFVLLNYTPGPPDAAFEDLRFHNLRTTVVSKSTRPEKYYDPARPGDYAIILSKNRRHGTVYEIGWGRMSDPGQTSYDFGRRIYVFRDNLARWHFLDEGPERGGGFRSAWLPTIAKVVWEKWRPDKIPLHLEFEMDVPIYKGPPIRDLIRNLKRSAGKDVIAPEVGP